MTLKKAIVFIFLVYIVTAGNLIDYYVNLIQQHIYEANYYRLPTDSLKYKPTTSKCSEFPPYDYIIIGAGSAGSVLANRLTEDPSTQVLLIEAGDFENDFTDIPAMLLFAQGSPYNWGYNTTRQTGACQGMVNRECAYPRGKGIGGSSIINACFYVRGNKRDYDKWAKQGNKGWAYKDVLPYFKKSENIQVDGVDSQYHGKGGYWNVEVADPNPFSPQSDAFMQANLELGYKEVDYNGAQQIGVSRVQSNVINGRRQSSGKAFLIPVMRRKNLKILRNSLVTKILINKFSKTAYGVKYSTNGTCYTVKARREVILSAGAINSPQLLMLSGIGPPAHLADMGIDLIQPLAVGENLQEHATYYGLYFKSNFSQTINELEEDVRQYLQGVGFLTIAMNSQAIGFYQTKFENTTGYPDLEIVMFPSPSSDPYFRNVFHLTDQTYDDLMGRINIATDFAILPIVLHPKSRGTVRLKSNSPYDYPLIDPRFLSDPYNIDREVMYEAIQLCLKIADTAAFKKFNATLLYAPLKACSGYEYLSKEFWYCEIEHLTSELFHPVGTCKMGPDPLKGAVVDDKLKVHGIKNLRVIDASIMPEIISGHTAAPTVMIAEKGADLLKGKMFFK